ncbi:glutamate synthase (NADPH) small chain, partial [Candidatus Hakubella thermalkaliphila]
RRVASQVHVVYRRVGEDMPAWAEEVAAAEEEGVRFHFLTNPVRVLGDGSVKEIECLHQALGEFDASGRRRPIPVEKSEFRMSADVVISAIGQTPESSCLRGEVQVNRDGTLTVSHDLATSHAGVFAAGDAVIGPATVGEAVAQGNLAALAVDNYLRGRELALEEKLGPYMTAELTYDLEEYGKVKRTAMPELPKESRQGNFTEIEQGLSEEAAQIEARRCLRCDLEYVSLIEEDLRKDELLTVSLSEG